MLRTMVAWKFVHDKVIYSTYMQDLLIIKPARTGTRIEWGEETASPKEGVIGPVQKR
jgi:hypothetical protein